jgi:3',5'-cyclic AMP phosphodiesterase CpdA
VRRLAEPFRTSAQLAKLARTPRRDGASLRFAVIGDAEPGRFWFWRALFNRDQNAFWKQLAKADRAGADFILQLGDMVSRGVPRNFRAFFNKLNSAAPRTPYLTVIGNHDRHNPHGVSNSRVYRSLFGGTNYAFDRGGRRFVVLDNSAGRITPAQFDWLRSVLSADKPAVVFTHIPPAPLGEWTDFAGRKGAGGFRQGAEEFMRLMSEYKIARVYVGHVHGLGVLDRGGVRYVLTGGGGSPLYPGPVKDRFHHYLTVEDGPDGLVETVHRSDGSSFILR